MRYKVKYKIDITIDGEDSITPEKSKFKDFFNDKKMIGEIEIDSGSPDSIKKKINKKLDDAFEKLEVWYNGEE